MRTLADLPFPMTDCALRGIPAETLVQAMIGQACQYRSLHKPLINVPCSAFHELGIGMDWSNSFVLFDYPSADNGHKYSSTKLTNDQAYRLLLLYRFPLSRGAA